MRTEVRRRPVVIAQARGAREIPRAVQSARPASRGGIGSQRRDTAARKERRLGLEKVVSWRGIVVIDTNGPSGPSERRHFRGCLLDGVEPAGVRAGRWRMTRDAAPGADHGCAGFTEHAGDTAATPRVAPHTTAVRLANSLIDDLRFRGVPDGQSALYLTAMQLLLLILNNDLEMSSLASVR